MHTQVTGWMRNRQKETKMPNYACTQLFDKKREQNTRKVCNLLRAISVPRGQLSKNSSREDGRCTALLSGGAPPNPPAPEVLRCRCHPRPGRPDQASRLKILKDHCHESS